MESGGRGNQIDAGAGNECSRRIRDRAADRRPVLRRDGDEEEWREQEEPSHTVVLSDGCCRTVTDRRQFFAPWRLCVRLFYVTRLGGRPTIPARKMRPPGPESRPFRRRGKSRLAGAIRCGLRA